jgi:hypothetical protein
MTYFTPLNRIELLNQLAEEWTAYDTDYRTLSLAASLPAPIPLPPHSAPVDASELDAAQVREPVRDVQAQSVLSGASQDRSLAMGVAGLVR